MKHLFLLAIAISLATGAGAQLDTTALHFSLSGYANANLAGE